MEIDWSKAPEGATHYDTGFNMFCNEDGYWRPTGTWVFDNDQNEWGTARYIERPATWTGEGLPPVGTVCEANNGGASDYFKCVVVGTHYKTGRPIIDSVNSTTGNLTHAPDCWKFRPIRTPEQIAAEEREKAIQKMVSCAGRRMSFRSICESLYDAGYRKVEGGAQ